MRTQHLKTAALIGMPVALGIIAIPIARTYREQRYTLAMIEALKKSDVPPARLRAWISKGANVNGHDNEGFTPLYIAAMRNDLTAMGTLLNEGAHINAPIPSGDTPLTIAAVSGYFDGTTLLIQRGANGDIRDKQGRTTLSKVHNVLHDVMQSYHPLDNREEKMVRLLKKAGAKE